VVPKKVFWKNVTVTRHNMAVVCFDNSVSVVGVAPFLLGCASINALLKVKLQRHLKTINHLTIFPMAECYNYKQLTGEKEIRLVHLLPSTSCDNLSLAIEHVSFNSTPSPTSGSRKLTQTLLAYCGSIESPSIKPKRRSGTSKSVLWETSISRRLWCSSGSAPLMAPLC
jgi:hypothetical protein